MCKSTFLKVGILSGLMLLALSSTSFAAIWKQEDGGAWRFVKNDGGYAVESWAQSGSDWYYMDADGLITTDSLIEGVNNRTYYVKSDGVMAKNEWISFENEETPAEPIWYYFGEDGTAYKGRDNGKVRPRLINGKNYAFDSQGHMIRGFVTESGEVVEDAGDNLQFIDAMYCFGQDGAMLQNEWLQYEDAGRYNGFSQLAQRNYNEYEQLWLYFGEKGKKTKANTVERAKVTTINDVKYSFDENGVMIPGLFATNSTIPATSSNATIRYGHLDTSGENKGDYWTFTVPNEAMSEQDYSTGERSWFRTKKDGSVIKDRIATVLGRKYAFDEIGRMQTGFVVMLEDHSFGIQFDVEEWSKEDFLTPIADTPIPTIDRGDLYLFGVDELNDGSMITGEVSVTLRDETVVFGFRNNGKAIGTKGVLTRHDNKYYFNGLRLDADAALKYGVVKDAGRGYVVVGTDGKVVTGSKILKDGEDNWIIINNSKFVARVNDADKPKKKKGRFYHYDSSAERNHRLGAEITFATDGMNNLDSTFVLFE